MKISRERVVPVSWCPLDHGWLKLNFDGAVFKEINAIGLGAVVRDATGCFIAGLSKRVDNMTCPMTAEALAALDGIKLAQQLECQRLCIEGDAADIISALKSREANLSKIGHIVDKIKKLADSFQEVQISQVKRTGNTVAHFFVKEALFVQDMRYWRDAAPDFVVPNLLEDILKVTVLKGCSE
ncbi:hypothetical protein RJ640_015875 [Escallonia rubra]|uniref:RNase H type-1 domain-containing protein n=1 Tax=Escallonia rubra TaxID=112253 RepID=A0AA88QYJ2_9ASTE|nr:hypothetical protein RJ640_015875 [Escallonia rubra]